MRRVAHGCVYHRSMFYQAVFVGQSEPTGSCTHHVRYPSAAQSVFYRESRSLEYELQKNVEAIFPQRDTYTMSPPQSNRNSNTPIPLSYPSLAYHHLPPLPSTPTSPRHSSQRQTANNKETPTPPFPQPQAHKPQPSPPLATIRKSTSEDAAGAAGIRDTLANRVQKTETEAQDDDKRGG